MNALDEALEVRSVDHRHRGSLISNLPAECATIWVRHGDGLVGWGEAARLETGAGEDRFERADHFLQELFGAANVADEVDEPGTGPVAFGSFTFDPRAEGSIVTVPEVVLGRRGERSWLTLAGDHPRPAPVEADPVAPGRVRYAGTTQSELRWVDAVDAAVATIEGGTLDKVVLARDVVVWSEEPLDTRALAARLAQRFPSCFTFLCDGFVGATPELLVRRIGDSVGSLVLAGTAPRGRDEADDASLGDALLRSDKDVSEHRMAVESVRERLADVCRDLSVDNRPTLLKLENVQHLATRIEGRLGPPLSSLRLAGLLHPSAAVCGTPTDAALDTIRRLEDMPRNRYAGPVGWMDARGDGEWGIALRCAEVNGTRARLFAGAGIVSGSLPEWELEETRLKLRAMRSALDSR